MELPEPPQWAWEDLVQASDEIDASRGEDTKENLEKFAYAKEKISMLISQYDFENRIRTYEYDHNTRLTLS